MFLGCVFRELLSMVKVGYLVAAPDGTILYLNKAFANMFQMAPEEAIGSNICRYFPNSRLLTVMRSGMADEAITFSYKGREAFISRYPMFCGETVMGGYIEVYSRDITELSALAQRVQSLAQKVRLGGARTGQPQAHYTFNDIITQDPGMMELKNRARKYAQTNFPVLILGETGTGKELLAHSIHAASPRARGPLIAVNCAAIPETLLESELFGYEEGTFTGARHGGHVGKFELADGGTIFLDEIGTLSLPLQAKLLRVIESREIQKLGQSRLITSDFRLIAATNVDLWQCVDKGTFRLDLLYRLCTLLLRVPPLRERKGDIPLLVRQQLAALETSGECGELNVNPEIMAMLENHPWPGNVRELYSFISAAAISLDERSEDTIMPRHLPANVRGICEFFNKVDATLSPGPSRRVSLRQARSSSEWEIILAAVRETGGNKSRAASLLGISRNELYRKLRKHAKL
jgi:transcriptional regulator with PAS, ATPase and Fis domain